MAEKMCYLEFEYQIWATRVYGWVQKDDIQLYYRSAIWNWHFFGGGGGGGLRTPFSPEIFLTALRLRDADSNLNVTEEG